MCAIGGKYIRIIVVTPLSVSGCLCVGVRVVSNSSGSTLWKSSDG